MSMVFKNFTGDIKNVTSLTSQLSLFGKSFKSIGEDFSKLNGKGRIVNALFSSSDTIALNNFNNALQNGSTNTKAFITHMKNASLDAQDTARQIINLRFKISLLNRQYKDGIITEQKYNAQMQAIQQQYDALSTRTQTLTVRQRLLAGAIKTVSMAFETFKTIAITYAISGIISLITDFVNKEKELSEQSKEMSKEYENEAQALDELKTKYKEICDSQDSDINKTKQVNELKQELINTYELTEDALKGLNAEYETGNKILEENIKLAKQASRGNWLGKNQEDIENANKAIKYQGITSDLADGVIKVNVATDGHINLDNISSDIKDMFRDISFEASGLLSNMSFDVYGSNMIERYENIQDIITEIGKKDKRTDEEELLLKLLNKESDKMEEILDVYRDTFETEKNFLAQNLLDAYAIDDNAIENVSRENYEAWKDGLLKTTNDKDVRKALSKILDTQFADFEKYFDNLNKAYKIFDIDRIFNTDEDKIGFLKALDPKELEFATQIPDLFAEGLDGATAKIKEWNKKPENAISFNIAEYQEDLENVYGNIDKLQGEISKLNEGKFDFSGDIKDLIKTFPEYSTEILNASGDTEQLKKVLQNLLNSQPNDLINSLNELKESLTFDRDIEAVDRLIQILKNSTAVASQVETLSDALDTLSNRQSLLSTVWKEMNDDGHISISTYKSLIECGDDYVDAIEEVDGQLKVNVEKLKELTKKKYADEIATLKLTEAVLEYKVADAGRQGKDSSIFEEELERIKQDIQTKEKLLSYYDNYDYTESNEPESVTKFKENLAKKQHQLEMNQISEAEYYAWLDSESKRVYGNLTDYEDELWKHQEEVYKWRKEQEQDLFDQKIENLEKEKDKALENNDFETAKTTVNTQITETQNRINELKASGRQDVDDEIKQLEEDLEDLGDTLNDICSKEYEFKISISDDAIEEFDERIEKGDVTAFADKEAEIQKKKAEAESEINRLLGEGFSEDSDTIRNLRNDLEDFDKELFENSKKEYEFKISLKTNEIDDLDREFEKSGDTSIYDKQIGIYEGLIKGAQDEIDRLLDLGYSMESEEIQNLLDDMNGYSDKIADIWDKQTEIIKDNVDEQIKALDRNIENTGDTSLYADKIKVYEQAQKDIYDRIEFYRKQGYAEDSQVIKDLKEQWVEYGEAITDTLQEQADAQIEAYSELMDEQKEILEKQKETQDELFDGQIKALEKQKEALEDVNEELERENALNEKLKAIEDARNNVYKNRRMVYTAGGGWEIRNRQEDLDKVEEAQKDYADELRQQEIDKIQDQIDAIEEAKNAFDESIDKQITAIEQSVTDFENAIKSSYEIRKKLDKEFIASIVGEDKADEYLAKVNIEEAEITDANINESNTEKNNTPTTEPTVKPKNSSTGTESSDTESIENNEVLSSTDKAIQKIYETLTNKGAFTRNVTLDNFVSDFENGTFAKTLTTQIGNKEKLLDGTGNYATYNTINNSPVFNFDIKVDGRNKDDVELANMMGDIAEQKVITGLQAFNAGIHNASSVRRSAKR